MVSSRARPGIAGGVYSLAEQSDLILELGAFAIREAVAAVRLWDSTDPDVTRPYVTVNLSVHQFTTLRWSPRSKKRSRSTISRLIDSSSRSPRARRSKTLPRR